MEDASAHAPRSAQATNSDTSCRYARRVCSLAAESDAAKPSTCQLVTPMYRPFAQHRERSCSGQTLAPLPRRPEPTRPHRVDARILDMAEEPDANLRSGLLLGLLAPSRTP